MRLSGFVLATCVLVLPAVAAAQGYSGAPAPDGVLRPATTVGWRNYMTVPDGPCGPPMSVETDCYVNCRPCGPLRPICFLQRVGRMLDCLVPCNMCCRGGCGILHGCHLGGRTWGHCNVCCGGACGGGSCGGGCGGCCSNPCGSVFSSCCTPSCTTGGHCHSCSSALPGLSDPFQDDPLPPKPTALPATEVRRIPTYRSQPAISRAPAAGPMASPYKIVRDPNNPAPVVRSSSRPNPAGGSHSRQPQSVLRRASADQAATEPRQFQVDRTSAAPIIRSQSPDEEEVDYAIPHNPLRK
jgi:hypothetical protein